MLKRLKALFINKVKPVEQQRPSPTPKRVPRNVPIPNHDIESIRSWLDEVQDKHHG